MKTQRNWLNYLRTAGLSRGYYLHVLVGGLAFLTVLGVYASTLLNEISLIVLTIPDAELAGTVQSRLMVLSALFFACFLSFILGTVFYIVILSHRVGGPMVAIEHVIEELKKGNYEVRRNLRKDDELTPIMMKLHELAETLKNTKSSI